MQQYKRNSLLAAACASLLIVAAAAFGGPIDVPMQGGRAAGQADAFTAQADDHLSVGAALNIYYGQLELSRNVTLGAPPTPEGHFRLTGQDFAVGVTPSVLWKIDDRNSIGAYYRSPFSLDFDGNARLFVPG